MLKLTTVAVVALFSLSPPPQSPGDEIAALRKEIRAL
jgi:hypothetical protein